MLHNLFERIKENTTFRVKLFLALSFICNLAYACFLFTVSKLSSSNWFLSLAIYYILLATARFFLFTQICFTTMQRAKIYTLFTCGVFLLVINLAISTISFLLLFHNPQTKQHEIIVIALATYTFSALTVAIIGCVKFFKRQDYLFSCAKVFSLISASVSLLPLTNTMLTTFGEDTARLRNTLFPILCIAVACFITVCAVYMICRAYLDLKVLNHEK